MRLPTISTRRTGVLALALFTMMPLLILSQDVAGLLLRDNENYFRFYGAILGGFQGDPYRHYSVVSVGAREPLSFAYLYVFAAAGAPYVVAILFKNVVLIWALSRFMMRHLGTSPVGLLFMAYISTNYYVFGLMSEIQRLGLAVIILLLIAGSGWGKQAIGFLAACLFHSQTALLAPLMLVTKHWIIGAILSVALAPVLLYFAWDKIAYYFDPQLDAAIKFAAVSVPFGAMALLFGKRTTTLWLLLTATLGAAAIMLGTGRVIIFYWEALMLAFFIKAREYDPLSAKAGVFFIAILVVVIPYNLWRIASELGRLDYWT